MTLEAWINSKTTKVVANMFEVDESTVRRWRLRNMLPRPSEMRGIKKASKGQVTYEEMIEGFLKARAGKEGL